MDKISKETIREVAVRSGLRDATVLDLLRSGWQYTEEIYNMPKWQRPGPEVTHGR